MAVAPRAAAAPLSAAGSGFPAARPWSGFWRRFRRHRLALAGAAVLAALAFLSAAAPWLAPYDPNLPNLAAREQPPSPAHWLGTDELGRDVLSRLLWGGRISLTVGLVAVGIAVSLGTAVGAVAGYFGGWVDQALMRLVDVVLSFPTLILLIVMASLFPPSIYSTMAVIGLVSWTGVARLVRGQFLALREREFVEAARAAGAGPLRLIGRHLLPNALAPVTVAATLGVASAILAEASLSFLGLGVPPPTPSWGNMLSQALAWRVLVGQPWIWVPPGLMIFLAVLSINLVGDALRDALDPRVQ